ncbi:MAG: hypothetical protein Q9195_002445 [Heterodermia aff. obscurata]
MASSTNWEVPALTGQGPPALLRQGRALLHYSSTPRVYQLGGANASAKTVGWTDRWAIEMGQPPMHDFEEIFADLASRAKQRGLLSALSHLNGRNLRIATMCSGTDCPILAARLIGQHWRTISDKPFEMEHIFSAEIHPVAQAFISRNFPALPLIFRDVREIAQFSSGVDPTTAYGAPAKVPGNIDVLIAGFACVDFSKLNRNPLGAGEVGESSDTGRAILTFANIARPAIVILENVIGAPWEKTKTIIRDEMRYSAEFIQLDTKDYYIPQTRNRVYLIMVDQDRAGGVEGADEMVNEWKRVVKLFERPASSPMEAFLLDANDRRVHKGQNELRPATKAVIPDWILSRGRHQKVRRFYRLGSRRPLTNWVEGGRCTFPDFGSMTWFNAQVSRVLDTIDINFGRSLCRGFDPLFKIRYWNLSQNVDRETDSGAFGLIGCLTPKGIHYNTVRGGILVGPEYLASQGIPISEIITTRETEQELLELAGNAMTSTVVGAAFLSALIAAWPVLDSGDGDYSMAVEDVPLEMDLSQLQEEPQMELFVFNPVALKNILDRSRLSVRLCYCEGPNEISKRGIQHCIECGHTACQNCSGIPPHVYDAPQSLSRVSPSSLRHEIRQALPMRLRIVDLDELELESSCPSGNYSDKKSWTVTSKIVSATSDRILQYESETRTEGWTMIYKGISAEGTSARLELRVFNGQATWYLFDVPSKGRVTGDPIRNLLEYPVARMSPPSLDEALTGTWQFRDVNKPTEFRIKISGSGELTRSWRSRQGLRDFAEEKVWDHLRIDYAPGSLPTLEKDISGVYQLLQDCGTSTGSLHKKIAPPGSEEEAVFMFHDPHPYGRLADDCFVFATTTYRLKWDERRHIIARLDPKWKPSNAQESTVTCTIQGEWHDTQAQLQSHDDIDKPDYRIISADLNMNVHDPISSKWQRSHPGFDCSALTTALLTCANVPLQQLEMLGWTSDSWQTIRAGKEQATLSMFTWLLEKVKNLNNFPGTWRPLSLPYDLVRCPCCVPKAPELKWRREIKSGKMSIKPEEDPHQAAEFEHVMKARPSPFTILIRSDHEQNHGCLRFGLNIATLAHRAVAKFPDRQDDKTLHISWRLDTDYTYPSRPHFRPFTLKNNINDVALPHNFIDGQALKPAQEQSFRWMIERDTTPSSFMEQEIEEAVIRELGWRATVRARRACGCKGGALTDNVGYGKTVLILALIAARKHDDEHHAEGTCEGHIPNFPQHQNRPRYNELDDFEKQVQVQRDGHIPIKATLIAVQPTLVDQWEQQIRQFLGPEYVVLKVDDHKLMDRISIRDFKEAHIVLVSWAVLDSKHYSDKLSLFGAVPEGPEFGGRAYDTWLAYSYQRTLEKVQELRELQDTAEFIQHARDLQVELDQNESNPELKRQTASKRLKGKAYAAARKRADGKAPKEIVTDVGENFSTPGVKWAARTCKIDAFNFEAAESIDDIVGVSLNLFCWARTVTDEYPRASEKAASIIAKLQAQSRWILSATPDLDVFGDVKNIARLLGVNLGIDDDSLLSMSAKELRRYREERTSVEMFQSLVHLSTPAWHEERHQLAQRFLNHFARQNDADLSLIECSNMLVTVRMSPIEQAVYNEISQQLHNQDMKVIRTNQSLADSERAKRMDQLLNGARTGEEALMLCATQFRHDLGSRLNPSVGIVHHRMIELRQEQKESLLQTIQTMLCVAESLELECRRFNKKSVNYESYLHLKKELIDGDFGDNEALADLLNAFELASQLAPTYDVDEYYSKGTGQKGRKGRIPMTQARIDQDGIELSEPQRTAQGKRVGSELNYFAGDLRTIFSEYVARVRAHRYFTGIRGFQVRKARASEILGHRPCDGCRRTLDLSKLAILSMCGHVGCDECLNDPDRSGDCIVPWCFAPAELHHIQWAQDIDPDSSNMGRNGSKIDTIVHLIKNEQQVKFDEQVLVFVQNDAIGHAVEEAFEQEDVTFHSMLQYRKDETTATGLRKIPDRELVKRLNLFQNSKRTVHEVTSSKKGKQQANDWRKVLVLNAYSEAAAGINLVNANHVFFVSPLSTNKSKYDGLMRQSAGRALRLMQTRKVYIYMCIVINTIDVDILEMRTSSRLLQRSGRYRGQITSAQQDADDDKMSIDNLPSHHTLSSEDEEMQDAPDDDTALPPSKKRKRQVAADTDKDNASAKRTKNALPPRRPLIEETEGSDIEMDDDDAALARQLQAHHDTEADDEALAEQMQYDEYEGQLSGTGDAFAESRWELKHVALLTEAEQKQKWGTGFEKAPDEHDFE